MKVICVSAHPDDMEIACSGTLKKLQDQGADIISVITVKPSKEENLDRSKEIVEQELERSYRISGFEYRIFDTDLHRDGRPNLIFDNITMSRLSKLIDNCDIAIIPNPQDSHQDHYNTHNLVWPIMLNRAREVWLMDSWPYCYQYRENRANLFHGIDWDFKERLLQCYSSYLTPYRIQQIYNTNLVYADRSRNSVAEAFTIAFKYA